MQSPKLKLIMGIFIEVWSSKIGLPNSADKSRGEVFTCSSHPVFAHLGSENTFFSAIACLLVCLRHISTTTLKVSILIFVTSLHDNIYALMKLHMSFTKVSNNRFCARIVVLLYVSLHCFFKFRYLMENKLRNQSPLNA